MSKFPEYKGLDLSQVNKDILQKWQKENAFKESLHARKDAPEFVFFDGPPSANGVPGIHHVIARTIKDCFCRYKTQQGYLVRRKAGWDTHGLPVELGVEKSLGITKEDIGKKISVDDYNNACRRDVMKFIDLWRDLTDKMGYWIDMDDPYITYDNKYIESCWYLLKLLYNKNLLYKGYTIQPYSPAAGTGLSTHELNQPGCYRDVKDTTVTAQFEVIKDEKSNFLYKNNLPLYILAWTTTPWTLPSNTALCVGEKIVYQLLKTTNPYSGKEINVVLAKERVDAYFSKHPYELLDEFTGKDLIGIHYNQLMPMVRPNGRAFEVISADYVTTTDGTGIVHIAPTFGADDKKAGESYGIVGMLLLDKDGKEQPMVDKKGRFYRLTDLDDTYVQTFINLPEYKLYEGRYVKNAYDETLAPDAETLDVDITVKLKKEDKAFKIEKHTHSYPHCWRTDKPVLYYPLDSWFIRTTAVRDRLIELNNTINWKPASTGTGRFGNWLENLQDWNLSRSRYWGTPLPIWRTEDGKEEICIGSIDELKAEIEKAIEAGIMTERPDLHDLHRPFIDQIYLVSKSGKKMFREPDLIDVWFDSGAMQCAQYHIPFENQNLPTTADFIAEGVDQTRGWFFTLHAIGVMCFDRVAFRNVVSNGLVLDKNGNKMSKRLGNAIDPFEVIEKYGADTLRWYMMTNSQPWDNLKFDIAGVDEVKRKFFGTLYNTYSFFALYANIDNFTAKETQVDIKNRPEIDRWIISLLNTLIAEVTDAYDSYEPTRAGRAIENFVMENLSNWYVRLNRKRFWGGEMNEDKLSAYQTLYECLLKVAQLSAPLAPFFAERLYLDLTGENQTVHLAQFPKSNNTLIDKELEERMAYAQSFSSMILALRRKVSIKVRQPLKKIMIPILDKHFQDQLDLVKNLILTEVNVKELEYISGDALKKKIKPNFKTLGKKCGKEMKTIAERINNMSQQEIAEIESNGKYTINNIEILASDVEILSEDIPGFLVSSEGKLTVALDITITDELKKEGIARELINRIQNLRKDSGFDVTDKIKIQIFAETNIDNVITDYGNYIGGQTLAVSVEKANTKDDSFVQTDIEQINAYIKITKV